MQGTDRTLKNCLQEGGDKVFTTILVVIVAVIMISTNFCSEETR